MAIEDELAIAVKSLQLAMDEIVRLNNLINSPELHDFSRGVMLEAAHQRERWSTEHDAGKSPEDWIWLLGHLAGKACYAHRNGDVEKALHHTISSAAVLANWHSNISGTNTSFRPGIDPAEHDVPDDAHKENT